MLTKIRLQNFQSHKDTTLDLGKLTMLTGGSNSGKSAALRGIIGLLKNDAASSYVTWDGSKNLTVTFTFDDGYEVSWVKGKENRYVIQTPSGETQVFEKVGSEVPEEVAEVLRLTPLVMEDGRKVHVNVHGQLEAPFLISDTPGQVAKMLGELTAASKLYAAVNEGNRRNREASSRKKLRRDDLVDVRLKLEDFTGLDNDLELLAEAEELEKQYVASSDQYAKLVIMRRDYEQSNTVLADMNKKLERLQPLVDLDLGELAAMAERAQSLQTLRDRHVGATTKLSKLTALEGPLAEAANVTGLDEALQLQQRAEALRAMVAKRDVSAYDLGNLQEKYEKIGAAAAAIDKALAEAYAELTECPSCGQELTADEAKEHLLKEVA